MAKKRRRIILAVGLLAIAMAAAGLTVGAATRTKHHGPKPEPEPGTVPFIKTIATTTIEHNKIKETRFCTASLDFPFTFRDGHYGACTLILSDEMANEPRTQGAALHHNRLVPYFAIGCESDNASPRLDFILDGQRHIHTMTQYLTFDQVEDIARSMSVQFQTEDSDVTFTMDKDDIAAMAKFAGWLRLSPSRDRRTSP